MSDALIGPETTLQEMFELMRDMGAAIMHVAFRDENDIPVHTLTLTDGKEPSAMMIPAVERVQKEHDEKPDVPPPTVLRQKKRRAPEEKE